MQRLTLTEFIITVAIVLGLLCAGSWLLQSKLLNLNTQTSKRMGQVSRGY